MMYKSILVKQAENTIIGFIAQKSFKVKIYFLTIIYFNALDFAGHINCISIFIIMDYAAIQTLVWINICRLYPEVLPQLSLRHFLYALLF